MPKAKLDHAFALTAFCEEGRKKTDYYDEAVTGFVLECRSTGGKTFYLRYDQDGRQRQVKLAAFGDAPFAQIKRKAERLRAEVSLGGDPAATKAAARAVPIYAELAAMHLADAELHQRSYSTTEMYVRRHIVPRWGKVRLTDVDGRAVAQWLADKRAEGLAPATVLKIKAILGRSFELGARWGVAGCERNPVRGVQSKPVNNARERFLTAEEAARLRVAVAASKNPQLQHIVGLLLFTGARVRELLDARWENVDVERQAWLIPTSKTGKPRHVPLSTPALAIVAALPRFDGCPWLLPNPDTRKPFVSIKHAWQGAREAAGLPGLRIHDLRHSAASFMVNNGVDLFAGARYWATRATNRRSGTPTSRTTRCSPPSRLARRSRLNPPNPALPSPRPRAGLAPVRGSGFLPISFRSIDMNINATEVTFPFSTPSSSPARTQAQSQNSASTFAAPVFGLKLRTCPLY